MRHLSLRLDDLRATYASRIDSWSGIARITQDPVRRWQGAEAIVKDLIAEVRRELDAEENARLDLVAQRREEAKLARRQGFADRRVLRAD